MSLGGLLLRREGLWATTNVRYGALAARAIGRPPPRT
jgi:hypothetical protein